MWSLRTFGFTIASAHLLGVRDFGLLAAGLIVHFALLRLIRSALTDTLLTSALREGTPVATAGPLAVAALASFVVPVGGLVYLLWPSARTVGVVMIFVPMVAFADANRMRMLAIRNAGSCLIFEVLWTGVLFAAVATLTLLDASTAISLMVAWSLAGGVHLRHLGAEQDPVTAALKDIRTNRRRAAYQATETLVDIAASYGALAAVAGMFGAAALGSIQAAQSATGIANFPFTTAVPVFVLMCARFEGEGRSSRFSAIALASCSVGVCGLWGVTLRAADGLGVAVLGDEVWLAASPLVIPIALFVGAVGAQSILNGRLRALGRSAMATRLRLISSGLMGITVGVAMLTESLPLIAWCFGGVGLAGTLVWMIAPEARDHVVPAGAATATHPSS